MQDGVELETETQTLLTASVCCSEHYRLLSHTPLHPRLTIVRVILLVRVNITSHTEPGPHVTADTQTVTVTIVVWQNLSGPNVKWDLEPAAREGWGGRVGTHCTPLTGRGIIVIFTRLQLIQWSHSHSQPGTNICQTLNN